MSSPDLPPAPDYAEANKVGIETDAATLPFRLGVSQAANLGTKYTDPTTGKEYDFTGYGLPAQNQVAVDSARQLLQAGSDISLDQERKRLQSELELLPQFNKLNLDQQQAAIDQALAASKKYTENTYQQNLEYMPLFGDMQRSENAKAFDQNLELGKKGTYETAEWQKELLPILNKVYSGAQADSYAAANDAARAANPEAYAARTALGQQIAADLAKGGDMSDAQKRNYTEQVRAAQAGRGNILGDSASFDEALQLTGYGDQLQKDRQAAALSFINSRDLAPQFQTIGAVNPVVPNFGATQALNPQVPNMNATTAAGPNLNPAQISQMNPLALFNPNAGQSAVTQANNVWQTQFKQASEAVDPWMQGLGMVTQGAGAAASLMAL